MNTIAAFTTLFTTLFSRTLCYRTQGGSNQEGLAQQKPQSRSCMALSYFLASTLTLIRGCPNGGNFLVLDSANVDECLHDYLTKHDCSSADINPIGGISKADLAHFLRFVMHEFNLPVLVSFVTATPTTELEPITSTYTQSDKTDIVARTPNSAILAASARLKNWDLLAYWQRLSSVEWKEKCMTPRARFWH